MAQLQQLLTLAMALSTITVLAFATIPLTTANALQEGDNVTFLIREDQTQPQPPSTPNDRMVFTGSPSSTTDVSGCGTGTRPVQKAVLVDVDGRSGALDVIVISQTDPVPQGTELKSFTANGACTMASDGLTYNRYLSTVTRTQ